MTQLPKSKELFQISLTYKSKPQTQHTISCLLQSQGLKVQLQCRGSQRREEDLEVPQDRMSEETDPEKGITSQETITLQIEVTDMTSTGEMIVDMTIVGHEVLADQEARQEEERRNEQPKKKFIHIFRRKT